MKLSIPIVPTYIQGTFQALPKGKHFPQRYSIKVTFGSPIEYDLYSFSDNFGSNRKIYQSIVQDVYAAIKELRANS